MKKIITYGTYDHLHYGHINLLKNAKALGDYLIVGVTSDEFDRYRGKINVHQPLLERIAALEETGIADQIVVEEYEGQKIVDIKKYGVDIFTVGSDWEGHFDYLKEYCDVIYLPRTEGVSSTELRASSHSTVRIGIFGTQNPAQRFIDECKVVRECLVTGIIGEDLNEAERIAEETNIQLFTEKEAFYEVCDAVAIMDQDLSRHAEEIGEALERGKHVITEGPVFLKQEDAKRLFLYAKEHQLVIFDAVKTRYFPGYQHMLLLAKSGKIGQIKDVDVSFSQRTKGLDYSKLSKYMGGLYRLGGYLFSPILQLLGREYEDIALFANKEEEYDVFTRGFVKYPNATASFKAGLGVKTEGQLIITGTEGYIFVPAPWWKPDYFEIRHEDLRDTEKYFWQYSGEGFRYEILDFLNCIFTGKTDSAQFSEDDTMTLTRIIEEYDNGGYRLF